MALAARRVGLPTRRLSFTRAYGLLNAMIGKLIAVDEPEREQAYDRILDTWDKPSYPSALSLASTPEPFGDMGKVIPGEGLEAQRR